MAMDDKKFFSTSAGVLANGLSGLKTNVEEAQGISTEVEAAGGVPADLSSSQALAATMAGGGLDQSTIESLMAVANTAGGGGPGVGRRRSGMSAYACGPTRVIDFQPWITLIGTSSTPDVIQPARTWLNGESMPTYNMKILITAITQCTLVLESAPSGEGPWTQVHEETAWTPLGDLQARCYQPQISPKWIGKDGRSFWLVFTDFQAAEGKLLHYCFNYQKVDILTK